MTDFTSTWDSLLKDAGRTTGLVVRAVDDQRPRSLLAVDGGTQKRMVLLEMDISPRDLRGLPDWREITLHVEESTGAYDRSLNVTCESREYVELFSAVARDLVDSLRGVTGTDNRLNRVRERLQKWNRFLREHGHLGLKEDQVRGLFCELMVLRDEVLGRLDELTAVRAWKGPDGAPHDFIQGSHAVEVKATGTGARSDQVMVSNAQQLDDSGLDSLWLHVMRLEDTGLQGATLEEVVLSIRGRLEDTAARASFEQRLVKAGYLDDMAGLYPRRYSVTQTSTFRVQEGFPRITDVPDGVEGLRYRVHLSHMRPFTAPSRDAFASLGGR